MKVSLNTVKQYTEVDISVDELVEKINSQLGGVESIVDLGFKYKGATIVRIVSCMDHPNADRLRVCMVDDGSVAENVTRDENGHVQIVCGAQNARAGNYAVWLPPSMTVPSSIAEKQPLVLEARELRGVVSNGMLASARELGLGENHDGILEINIDEPSPHQSDIKPGASFAKIFSLDDTIIDIENKMFTHRPDCFGHLGVAREIAGIQHKAFSSPEWYSSEPTFDTTDTLSLTVKSDTQAVPRFIAVAMDNITIQPSPLWLQTELVRMGSKPINNIVDVTNYVMLLTGQPLHAYDYDKVQGNTLEARYAKSDETLALLNSKTIKLSPEDIVIADSDRAIGLAGVLGGAETEVDETTKRIILECATFDMYAVRRSSMRHGLFTEAVTRFNKGQSPLQNPYVLSYAIASIKDVSGGTISSNVSDLHQLSNVNQTPSFISVEFINQRLGLSLKSDEIADLLSNVEFDICHSCDDDRHTTSVHYTAPFWRTDIEIPEDIVEEVGRLYGFERLKRELPRSDISPISKNKNSELKKAIRISLSKSGANEILTYSFVPEKVLYNAGQSAQEAFKLANALSPELQYYRLSVLPSILNKVHTNIKAGHEEFVLFEIGKGHNAALHAADDEGLPSELEFVDLVYSSKKDRLGAPYYHIQGIVAQLCADLGVDIELRKIENDMNYAVTAPFDLSRSALLYVRNTEEVLGIVGEPKLSVIKHFKLPTYSAIASLDVKGLAKSTVSLSQKYKPLSRYPGTWQDICLRVEDTVSYAELVLSVESALAKSEVVASFEPIDIYKDPNTSHHQVTFRISMTDITNTISGEIAQTVLSDIAKDAKNRCNATVV